jgi:hypothetical protein
VKKIKLKDINYAKEKKVVRGIEKISYTGEENEKRRYE